MRTLQRSLVGCTLAFGLLLSTGCGSVKIGRILSDPSRFNNRNVRVQGEVNRSVGAIVAGVYEVRDETGSIYVLSGGSTPRKGSQVRVDGRVNSGVTFMGKSFGTILRENDHRVTRSAPPQYKP
jgi:hypothetical protein